MKVCVVGAGASGCMAAIFLARGGADVVLVEKNEKIGKKLYITGKGRCNLTNNCEAGEALEHVVRGNKFLRTALYGFTPRDTMEFFESAGLKLVTERGNRVFPESQKSSDVIKTLAVQLKKSGVDVRLNETVSEISESDGEFKVTTDKGSILCDRLIIAAGGLSYSSTGSTGDGYKFAKSLGHTVVEPVQALVPIILREDVSSIEGISLKNVRLSAFDENGKEIKSEFGEMLFTRNGISGPIALTLSSYVNRLKGVKFSLDLKPALDVKTLDERLIRDFDERKNQDIKNVSRGLLPERLNVYVLKRAGVELSKKVNVITKQERAKLVNTIKGLSFSMSSLAPFSQAVITSGGISLKELSPYMQSKLKKGVYFVGETIDVDALTGGFNLQLAFASGVAAARDILKSAE